MRSVIVAFAFALSFGGAAHGQSLLATGGAGDSGGDGGGVEILASDAVVAGAGAKAKAPKAPKVTTKPDLATGDLNIGAFIDIADLDASPSDLDPDSFEVTVRGDVLVTAGNTLRVEDDTTIVSTQGGVFVAGTVVDNNGANSGVDLALISLRKAVVVQGSIDLDGENAATGGDGGALDLEGAQVTIGGTSTVSARGGTGTGAGNDGGDGGSVDIRPATPVIHGSIAVALGADATVDVRGGTSATGGGADGGAGGDFNVDYSELLGNASTLTLAGRVDVRGGDAVAGAGTGGDAGQIRADVGGALAVTGVLDARGGAGGAGADGGAGGEIELGSRAIGKGPVSILVPGSTAVNANADGGAGLDGQGGAGGSLLAEADLRGIQWTGNLSALGGSSVNDDGADGGAIELMSWGPSKSQVRVDGSLSSQGSDADVDGQGSTGGSVTVVSLDGPVELTGAVNTSAGDAVGADNDAGGPAGDVFLLADDSNGLPDTGPNDDAIDLLDDLGGDIVLLANVTATGGNGGGGGSDGSDGGLVVIDADGDDGEEATNGTVELADGVAVNANGGNGSGGGASGDGGDITVRGSNGNADAAVSGVIQGDVRRDLHERRGDRRHGRGGGHDRRRLMASARALRWASVVAGLGAAAFTLAFVWAVLREVSPALPAASPVSAAPPLAAPIAGGPGRVEAELAEAESAYLAAVLYPPGAGASSREAAQQRREVFEREAERLAALGPDAAPLLLERLASRHNDHVRLLFLTALSRIDGEAGVRGTLAGLEVLKDATLEPLFLDRLVRAGDPASQALLEAVLRESPRPETRARLLASAARRGDSRIAARLPELALYDESAAVRAQALATAEQLGAPLAPALLEQMAHADPDPALRERATGALAASDPEAFVSYARRTFAQGAPDAGAGARAHGGAGALARCRGRRPAGGAGPRRRPGAARVGGARPPRPQRPHPRPLDSAAFPSGVAAMAHEFVFTMHDLRKVVPPDRVILDGITLAFLPGAKIGVLGAERRRQEHLLRIMAGVDKDFLGEARPMPGLRVGYLPQEPQLDPAKDVRGNVEEGVAETRELLRRFEEISAKFGEPLDDDEMNALLEEQAQAAGPDRRRERLGARPHARDRDGRAAPAARRRRRRHALGRRAAPRGALPAAAPEARPAAARRAHQPPRRRVGRVARALPARLPGHRRRRHARSLLPRQRGRLDPRARPRPRHPVQGQLLRLARAEAGRASRSRRSRPRRGGARSRASSSGCA